MLRFTNEPQQGSKAEAPRRVNQSGMRPWSPTRSPPPLASKIRSRLVRSRLMNVAG